VSPPSSSTASGSASVASPGTYTGTVTLTDGRSDQVTGQVCSAQASASTPVYAPLTISLAPDNTSASCPSMSSDAITYSATVTGGSGTATVSWTGSPAVSCSGSACIIDPSDATFCYVQSLSATANDPVCGSAVSETETYSKITQVQASNN
jgi:hypothetical protein